MSEDQKHEFTLEDILASTGTYSRKQLNPEPEKDVLSKEEVQFETTRIMNLQDHLFEETNDHFSPVNEEVVPEETIVYEQPLPIVKETPTPSYEDELENTQTITVQDDDEVTMPEPPRRTKTTVKKRKKLSKAGLMLMRLILIASLGVAAFSGWKIYTGLKAYREGNRTYEDLQVEYTKAGDTSGSGAEDGINFAALEKINPDFIGWLKLDGTVINYPVVQGTDNYHYLEHLFNGDVNHMGCIFMHYGNNPNMTDKNTWIFAHHTNNGSMFYTLESYKNQSFYNDHPVFTYDTPNGSYLMEPIAGTVLSGDDFSIETFMPSAEYTYNSDDFKEWVQFFLDRSTFKSNTSFDVNDQIVTMVTCTDDYQNARYALICKLTKVN